MEKKCFEIVWVGGEKDGEVVYTISADEKNAALIAERFAEKFYAEHEKEFDEVCGGVMVTSSIRAN